MHERGTRGPNSTGDPEDDETDRRPGPDELRELVVEVLARMEQEGPGAVEAACTDHPGLAEALRGRLVTLGELGLLGVRNRSTESSPVLERTYDCILAAEVELLAGRAADAARTLLLVPPPIEDPTAAAMLAEEMTRILDGVETASGPDRRTRESCLGAARELLARLADAAPPELLDDLHERTRSRP